jgi:multidrug efflux pump subunit AcrB
MRSSYAGLLGGLVFSIVLVYLLIVVNFQSWTDPFIIITALPAALAGIVLFLFLTRTTLSVPALDGRDHVHGRGHGQQHPGCFICKEPSR